MKILNIGSLNVDYVYTVDHIILPGGTEAMLDRMASKFPDARIVLTLGSDGAVYADKTRRIFQSAFKVRAVDTTAAGDTFTGYFLAGLAQGLAMEEILRRSAKAASIAVTRPGAAASIPHHWEVT